ncbi:MAG: 30S ribosomal protein S5 [Candidatus Woesearchaeota archaeon]
MTEKKRKPQEEEESIFIETEEEFKAPEEITEVKSEVFIKEGWKPKTEIGKKVSTGEINDIDLILDEGKKILEAEITDTLLPGLETELLMIGQAKGKFGGGQKRVFQQTQKKTAEGNKPSFATMAIVGNKNGYVGMGYGKSRETVPAREKAIRKAKMNIMKIKRGCGSWQCGCKNPHSIPFKIHGKCGSVEITLIPAPKGTGLIVEKECQRILGLAGIKDVWSKTKGHSKTKVNLIKACLTALEKLMETKIPSKVNEPLGIIEGRIHG